MRILSLYHFLLNLGTFEVWFFIRSVQFSCSVVSNSLRPHGLQYTMRLCPSPTPRVYPTHVWTSLVAQMVKRLPAMRETWVQSLGQEDPLEKETATHSSTLAWKIPWTEEPGRLQSMGSQRVGHDWATSRMHYGLNSEKILRRPNMVPANIANGTQLLQSKGITNNPFKKWQACLKIFIMSTISFLSI